MHVPIVLVADDEPANRAFVRYTLAAAGWQVVEAADGKAAIDAARETLPNLIIMDINMPELDGWHATAAIRAAGPPLAGVPILAYTSLALTDDMVHASGMDGRLPKPATPQALLKAAERWRPDGQLETAEKLAVTFGAEEIEQLVRNFRDQLVDALDDLDGETPEFGAHRIAGVAGTLGFADVSESWLRVSEGDLAAREDARRHARLAISEIDRKFAD